ncbi:MAG: hypothetical protein HC915_03070 [Anaerolineae bacterium]|nr:hypothetical protein [Anaerolineae bacterium]
MKIAQWSWWVAVLALGLSACGSPNTGMFEAALNGAQSATVHVEPRHAPLQLAALPTRDKSRLILANVEYWGSVVFQDGGDGHRRLMLAEAESSFAFFRDGAPEWEVLLSPVVPMDIQLTLHTGTVFADLRQLNLRRLDVEFGDAKAVLYLPPTDEQHPLITELEFGRGDVELILPNQAHLNFDEAVQLGSGAVTITLGEEVALGAEVIMHSGPLTLHVPSTTAMRIMIIRAGSGDVDLPASFMPVQATEDQAEQLWQTRNFPGAGARVELSIELGSGDLEVKMLSTNS